LVERHGLKCKDGKVILCSFKISDWIGISCKLRCLIAKLLGLSRNKNYFCIVKSVRLDHGLVDHSDSGGVPIHCGSVAKSSSVLVELRWWV
jgi:hypothetical protein